MVIPGLVVNLQYAKRPVSGHFEHSAQIASPLPKLIYGEH